MDALTDQEINDAIFSLLNLPNSDQTARFLEQNQWLLQKDTEFFLSELIAIYSQRQNAENIIARLMVVRGLLHRCRQNKYDVRAVLRTQSSWPLVNYQPLALLLLLGDDADPKLRIKYAHLALIDLEPFIDLNNAACDECQFWGLVNFHLGWGYHMLAKGGDNSAREYAISYLRTAVSTWNSHQSPMGQQFIGLAQIKLAYQLLRWPSTERSAHIEEALELLDNARDVLDKESTHYTDSLLSSGNGYLQRVESERLSNIETGLNLLLDAEKIADSIGERQAAVHHALAIAYRKRLAEIPENNHEKAAEHAQMAITLAEADGNHELRALTHVELATIHALAQGVARESELEEAITCAEEAFSFFNKEHQWHELAMVQLSLGNLYCDRIKGNRRKNHVEAIKYFEAVSDFREKRDLIGWAEARNNLGTAYAFLSSRAHDQNYEKSVTCFRDVLEVPSAENLPVLKRMAASNWGFLAFIFEQWQEALAAFEQAIAAREALYGVSGSELGRRIELAESTGVSAAMTYCLLQLKRPFDAFIQLEKGKTRQLAEALALNDFDLTQIPEEKRTPVKNLRQEIRQLEENLNLSGTSLPEADKIQWRKALQDCHLKLQQALEDIRYLYPDAIPQELAKESLLSLIPKRGAFVAPVVTTKGSAVFILPDGTKEVTNEHVMPLKTFTTASLTALLVGDEMANGEQTSYWQKKEKRDRPQAILDVTKKLWTQFMGPIHQRLTKLKLEKGAPVILLPQGGLGLLPLHAAGYENGAGLKIFADDFVVSYAPSAYALDISRKRVQQSQRQQKNLIAVVNPTKDLAYAETEAQAISIYFPEKDTQLLRGNEATETAVIHHAPHYSHLHFSCHGQYNWQDVMQSCLILAKKNKFTLAEILAKLNLNKTCLVVLSACETGVTDLRQVPDEYLGLPGGLMQAGAPGVISTLWPVDDLSTAILMEQFYRNYLENGMSPDKALSTAQQWLRERTRAEISDYYYNVMDLEDIDLLSIATQIDLDGPPEERPFIHPYHWAAFTFAGN